MYHLNTGSSVCHSLKRLITNKTSEPSRSQTKVREWRCYWSIGGSSGIIDRYLNFGVSYRSFNVCFIILLVPLIFVVTIWQGELGCHSLNASINTIYVDNLMLFSNRPIPTLLASNISPTFISGKVYPV